MSRDHESDSCSRPKDSAVTQEDGDGQNSQNGQGKPPLFEDISAESNITEMESMCMICEKNGTTRMLLTRIPFYKDVVIMSFDCPHCHYQNNELQATGRVQDQGARHTLTVNGRQDLNRQVVRTDAASVHIPHLEFEIPAHTQKGVLTTVEGIVERSITGLEQDQPSRRASQPDLAAQIDAVIGRLRGLLTNESEPWTLVINDPSGNSFIENPHAPRTDPGMTVYHYCRSLEEDRQLGFVADDEGEGNGDGEGKGESGGEDDERIGKDEVLMFNDNCSNCFTPIQSKMKVVDVPHFKSVIIMSSVCDVCGERQMDVKSGTGVAAQGLRHTLTISSPTDLNRDIIKSETCRLSIPSLEFVHETWVSGGKFTTVEGLLTDIKQQLVEKSPFIMGDSCDTEVAGKMRAFGAEIEQIISGETRDVQIILDDPAGNTYVQSVLSAGSSVDDRLVREVYDRSEEQNDELGLTHMNTEPPASDGAANTPPTTTGQTS